MVKNKKISVCMATYNGEKFINQQIDSILPQLGLEDELIISDDGSTDSTIEIIKEYSDERIKLIRFNSHDYTRNFENALSYAEGDIVFLSDQDDIWFDNKIEKVAECFIKNKCDLIVTDAMVVDKDCNILKDSYFRMCSIKKGFFHNWIRSRYIGSCMAIRREILDTILPIPGKSKYIAHDYWIACLSEKRYKVVLLEEPLMFYRRHEKNTSSGIQSKSNKSLFFRIYKRFYTLGYLFFR